MITHSISKESFHQMNKPQLIIAAREVGVLNSKDKTRSELIFDILNRLKIDADIPVMAEMENINYRYRIH